MKNYQTIAEVEAVLGAFARAQIPRAEWNHVKHLTVAAWTMFQCDDADDALAQMRAGIHRYNAALGIVSTPTGGYHETVTVFWTRQIAALYFARPHDEDLLAFINRTLAALGDGALIFSHYRRETLSSAEARQRWVAPDLRPDSGPARALR